MPIENTSGVVIMKHSLQAESSHNASTIEVHANDVNSDNPPTSEKQPLTILIAGAGIGGLTAAIALRQQGHHVKIFEQSRLASEIGAAVQLAPNSNGILRRLGIYAETFGANTVNKITELDHAGSPHKSVDLRKVNSVWQHPWHLVHRAHLHSYLRSTATSDNLSGQPAELYTSSKINSVNEQTATIELGNGERVRGDVVIGADGVHSVTRSRIVPGNVKPFSCGKSAFQFLIPREAIRSDSATAHLVKDEGELKIWYAHDRRIVMYPTSNNMELNFVAIHPNPESDASSDWNEVASMDNMLKVFAKFDAALLALISKADPSSLKTWVLLDMDEVPAWSKDRLALIGDAAHPFLPHQGQGAGAAIEDAATIATILPLGTTTDEVPERLRLYDQIRHHRATKVQNFSRLVDSDDLQKKNLDITAFTNFNFGHDEFDNLQESRPGLTVKRSTRP